MKCVKSVEEGKKEQINQIVEVLQVICIFRVVSPSAYRKIQQVRYCRVSGVVSSMLPKLQERENERDEGKRERLIDVCQTHTQLRLRVVYLLKAPKFGVCMQRGKKSDNLQLYLFKRKLKKTVTGYEYLWQLLFTHFESCIHFVHNYLPFASYGNKDYFFA